MVILMKEIYATVLDTDKEKLSSNADFFELGGSSLDTISLISSIESKVGIQSKLQDKICDTCYIRVS